MRVRSLGVQNQGTNRDHVEKTVPTFVPNIAVEPGTVFSIFRGAI